MARFQLLIYFLLAYAITWSAQIPALLYAHDHGVELTNEANLLHVIDLIQGELEPGLSPYLFLVMFAFGPTLAGIIVTAVFKGRTGLADLWARTRRVHVAGRWVLVVLLPPVLGVASLSVAFVTGGLQPLDVSFLVPVPLLPSCSCTC